MADAYESLRVGEKRPIYGTASTDEGTLQISGTPTVKLRDAAGTVVTGYDGVNASGWDTDFLAEVRAWYLLDTASLPPGVYNLTLTFATTSDDGLARTFEVTVRVSVRSVTLGSGGAGYTAWPSLADVEERLESAGVVLRDAASDRRIQQEIDAVTDEVAKRTRRQFVADTVDTTRTYDGSGTSELEVDEMVSLTSATVIGLPGDPGYDLSNVVLVQEQTRPHTRITASQGSLPAMTSSVLMFPYLRIFPTGRQNIQIVGKFGYGATVPVDLWSAVLGEITARLAREAIFDPNYDADQGFHRGRLSSYEDASVSEKYEAADYEGATQAHARYEAAIKRYTRSPGRKLRRMSPAMI